MPGSVITYQLYAVNQGTATAADVILTDALPVGVSYVSSHNETHFPAYARDAFTPTTDAGGVVWQLGSVPAGGYGYFTLTARIDDATPSGTILTNTAFVGGSDDDWNPDNNSATDVRTVYAPDAYEPDDYSRAGPISVDGAPQHHNFHTGTDTDWVWFNATLGMEYVIQTSNLGSTADTYLYLLKSDGSTVIREDNNGGGGLASRIIWVADESGICYVKVRDNASRFGPTITYDLSVRKYAPAPDLAISKRLNGLLRGGDVVSYTLAYTNAGTFLASSVTVTDRLPIQMAYSSDSGGGVPDVGGRVVTWAVGALAPGDHGAITMTAHVAETTPLGTWLTNTVEIGTPDAERGYADNTALHGGQAGAPWGGPDAFGYTYRTNERGGPAYSWVDIATLGTEVWPGASRDDEFAGPFAIGFDFRFYGQVYNELYVGSNGYVSFGEGDEYPAYYTLPDSRSPNNVIVPFGGDMYHTAGVSHIYYAQLSNPTRFVVQYSNLDQYHDRGRLATFQIILYPDGNILTHYKNVDTGFPPEVVGIENIDGTIGLDYGTNVYGGLAVRYYPAAVTHKLQSTFAIRRTLIPVRRRERPCRPQPPRQRAGKGTRCTCRWSCAR